MKRIPIAVAAVGLLVSLAVDGYFLAGQHHGEFWWSHVYGFFSIYGLIGALAIMGFAKALGGLWLARPEKYYDREDPRE